MANEPITREDVEAIVEKTVSSTLIRLGIDPTNPLAAQAYSVRLRAMADLTADEAFRSDLLFLRKLHLSFEGAGRKGFLTVIGIATTGLCTLIWMGVKAFLGK